MMMVMVVMIDGNDDNFLKAKDGDYCDDEDDVGNDIFTLEVFHHDCLDDGGDYDVHNSQLL